MRRPKPNSKPTAPEPAAELAAAARLVGRADAEFLLMSLLRLPRHRLAAARISPPAAARFRRMVERVRSGEPPQYVAGSAPFLDLDIHVDRRVLIPRPETEELVGRALERLNRPPGRILDYGTGSGCIAIALARAFPRASVVAVDSSAAALTVARKNARRYRVSARLRFVRAGTLAARPLRRLRDQFDLIVANPPYIPSARLTGLAPRVRDHEPLPALDGGPKGTKIVAMLLAAGPDLLAPGGLLAIEVDSTHRRFLGRVAPAAEVERDLAGHTRYAFLRRVK